MNEQNDKQCNSRWEDLKKDLNLVQNVVIIKQL